MDIKELLKQYSSLIEEIAELEREIRMLERKESRHERDKVKGSNPYFPYEPRTFNIEGYNIVDWEKKNARIFRRKNLLYKRKCKCEDLKLQIEEFISSIPDSLTRRVFQYRYMEDLEWLPISMRFGRTNESYSRMIHQRYLEGLK